MVGLPHCVTSGNLILILQFPHMPGRFSKYVPQVVAEATEEEQEAQDKEEGEEKEEKEREEEEEDLRYIKFNSCFRLTNLNLQNLLNHRL